MARALVVLACAACAACAEYGAGTMPHYDVDYDLVRRSEDYGGRAPDAPAALDYKYQEDHRDNTEKPPKNINDADEWRKVRRKQRVRQRPERADLEARLDELDENEEKERAGLRRRARAGRARQRPPARHAHEHEPHAPRRSAEHTRDRQLEPSDVRDVDREDYSEDKSKDFDYEDNFATRETTRKGKRRKPRDRAMSTLADISSDEETLLADRRTKTDDAQEPQYVAVDAERRGWLEGRPRLRPVLEQGASREPVRAYDPRDQYGDYYDMKRVQSIKDKLPVLLRRTTTVLSPTPTPGGYRATPMPWANRRLGVAPLAPAPATVDSDSDEIIDLGSQVNAVTQKPYIPKRITDKTYSVEVTEVAFKYSPLGSEPSAMMSAMSTNSTTELSLAEKSRLSILKKAQRKDGVKEETTKKPPVLLQVTEKLATVVVMEPPGSRPPWLPGHVLMGDSPDRLERVKKLMRHKLVAQARNIQDLTDNWDEMVCDYIDVALLDSGGGARARAAPFICLAVIVCCLG